MILKQYYLGCLAHASYLVGDEESGVAAVIDPQRDTEAYSRDAAAAGLRIGHVFLTHFHADFLAGHLELRDREGSRIHLGSRAAAEYDFEPMADGQVLHLGPKVRLEVLHTPGHSPESICILVYDRGASETRPHAALTGDTLFIGDVGRPDLRAALGWTAEELGRLLYDSVRTKLLPLPDETLIYPAHGAGSLCGKQLSEETVSTLGVQRVYNYALQEMSQEEFVRLVTSDQPDAPDYFTYDAILNTRERPTLDRALQSGLQPLSIEAVVGLRDAGAQLLDVREPAEFAGAHLVASLNIALGGKYATWAGTLLDPERWIVVVAEPGREQEAATRLGRIGFDRVAGYLDRGMAALEGRPDLVARTERIAAASLAEQLASGAPPLVVDVRTAHEWETEHIAGSANQPLNHLSGSLDKLADLRRPIVVHCASGYRSSIAASLLLAHGSATAVSELVGGLEAWRAAHLPTVGPRTTRS